MTSASRWNLFPVLGLATPDGFNADLRLDYYSERGPGVGVDMDYKRETWLNGPFAATTFMTRATIRSVI